MNFEKRKLNWKNAILISVLSIVGCDSIPDLHPHVVDFQFNETREYQVTDKRNLTIKFKESHPLPYAHNMWCFPAEDVVALRDYWNRNKNENNQGAD